VRVNSASLEALDRLDCRLAGLVNHNFIGRDLSRAFAGRADVSFIAISDSDASGTFDHPNDLLCCHDFPIWRICSPAPRTPGPRRTGGTNLEFSGSNIYLLLLSCFSSAMRACWPAAFTAFMNAWVLFGVAALPERIERNDMRLP
jgi:hypothetical protein